MEQPICISDLQGTCTVLKQIQIGYMQSIVAIYCSQRENVYVFTPIYLQSNTSERK